MASSKPTAPANAAPPVRMAEGRLLPAARDNNPATPLMTAAASRISTTLVRRGISGRGRSADGLLGREGAGRALSIMATTKGVEVTTIRLYLKALNFHRYSRGDKESQRLEVLARTLIECRCDHSETVSCFGVRYVLGPSYE
jgi:hypothetical protein